MKRAVMSAMCAIILLMACNKKEPQRVEKNVSLSSADLPEDCAQQIILAKAMKISGSEMLLPVATKICIADDASEITIVLPKNYSFVAEGIPSRAAPVLFATYHCLCSGGGACQVMFADDLGFGCLHSSCTGGCTGQFTYKGYSVNRVINLLASKDEIFSIPEMQQAVAAIYQQESPSVSYSKQTLYGISFYIVRDEELFLSEASCDCEGTKACTLKVKDVQSKTDSSYFKIYYCDGPCNGCELTVN